MSVLLTCWAAACGDANTKTSDGSSGRDADMHADTKRADLSSDLPSGDEDTTAPATIGECSRDSDCAARLPQTTPAGCAMAQCDTLQHKCHFVAKDQDGDGHPAKTCSATLGTIETGDDCNDGDPNTYPGAWDGPPGGTHVDRCDHADNDCDGMIDNGTLMVTNGLKSCQCDPDNPSPCYEFANGAPIDPSTLGVDGKPKGACKLGTQSCTNGVPGLCVGAIGPGVELCDNLDHDCNGVSGNAGNAGKVINGVTTWYKDADGDNYGDVNTPSVQSCSAPGANWRPNIPKTDCNDGDPLINPGQVEICDGKDNNCSGIADEGIPPQSTCTVGQGACQRFGQVLCTAGAFKCNAVAGAPMGAQTTPYTDLAHSYTSWDWDCDGNVVTTPSNPEDVCGHYMSDSDFCLNHPTNCHSFSTTLCRMDSSCGGQVHVISCTLVSLGGVGTLCELAGTSTQPVYCQ